MQLSIVIDMFDRNKLFIEYVEYVKQSYKRKFQKIHLFEMKIKKKTMKSPELYCKKSFDNIRKN